MSHTKLAKLQAENERLKEIASERLKTLEWHRQQHMDAQGRLSLADKLAEAIGKLRTYECGVDACVAYHAYTLSMAQDEYYIRNRPAPRPAP